MEIRRIGPGERLTLSQPLHTYAFSASPADDWWSKFQPYLDGDLTLVAEDGATALAEASAIPMRQNVRDLVCAMAGVGLVASHPLARRRGFVRALMIELLGQMRDAGHAVSVLYPFRPSFYQRFGYVGLPKPRTVTFAPAGLGPLLDVDLPGEVTVQRIADGYEDYRDFIHRLLQRRHGFAVLPDYRELRLRDANERWLVTARIGGETVGMLIYHIQGYGGDFAADHLLTTGVPGRALLLRFLAGHVDQIARVVLTVAPDELPELWATDFAVVTEGRIALPDSLAPMARVLSVEALAGMRVGPGRAAVQVVDDPFIAGHYLLDGATGALEVTRGESPAPAATLTAAGLSGLVYGVLDPDDVVVRNFGSIPDAVATELRELFPRRVPYLPTSF